MPPVSTSRNGLYGGPRAGDKYSPLGNLALVAGNSADYDGFVNQRQTVFNSFGGFPATLELAIPISWNVAADEENSGGPARAAKDPPLVVVSSNRAQWIKAGFDRATNLAATLQARHFNNLQDKRALKVSPLVQALPPSPPLYAPVRQGAQQTRSVFIVVHQLEYNYYKATLAGTGATVVGWRFTGGAGPQEMVGFGATRFAALEFCKALRTHALGRPNIGNAPWEVAWLLDDNVVAFEPFAGFAAVEAALTGPANPVCAGFSGFDQPRSRAQVRTWYNGLTAAEQDGTAGPGLPGNQAKGLIQQASAWNIGLMAANPWNFGPWFVTAKEDLALTEYFNSQPAPPYLFYNIRIWKEAAGVDGAVNVGAGLLGTAKDALNAAVALAEGPTQVQAPGGGGGLQTLSNYVNTQILPNSNNVSVAQGADAAFRNLTVSRAMEQIVARAVKGSANPPPRPANPGATFLAGASRALMFAPPGNVAVGTAPMTLIRRWVP